MALNLSESPSDAAEFAAVRDGTPPTAPVPEKPVDPPAAEPAKAPEAPTAAKPAEPPKRQEMVPHAALHEAREEAKQLKAELAAFRAQAGRPAEEPKPPVDIETDPLAALRELRDWQQGQQQQTEQHHQLQAFSQRVVAHEADFAAATPDYGKAVAHLRDARAAELRSIGVPDHMINQQLHNEAIATALFAFEKGKNPGEVFYELAKVRGYKLDATPPADPTPPAAEPVPEVDAATEQKRVESQGALERIQRGQRAARPTAGGGGNAPSGELSLADGANLTGAAFDKWFEANAKRLMN